MNCRLCESEKPLIDAHIIPRSIYEEVKGERDSYVFVVKNTKDSHAKRSRTGLYDKEILCKECDNYLGKLDHYGKNFIFNWNMDANPIVTPANEIIGFEIVKFDYEKLKLFFLSILWRASISTLEYFSSIQLAKYENLLRHHIREGDPGRFDEFPVILTRYKDVDTRLTMSQPIWMRLQQVRYYKLYLVACNAYIKSDHRPAFTSFQALALNPNAPLIVKFENFRGSNEAKLLENLLRKRRTELRSRDT